MNLHIHPKGHIYDQGAEAIRQTFSDVDWSFSKRGTRSELESIHPYPAKFIPDIPGAILDRLPVERHTVVLDPFVGSGTTLVECQRRGIHSVGVDLNPIACLISRVKTSALPPAVHQTALGVVQHAMMSDGATTIPDIPNLFHWFDRQVAEVLTRLVQAVSLGPSTHQDVLKLALSSVLVRVSRQESDTRYAAISKNTSPQDVYDAFIASSKKIENALLNRGYHLASAAVVEKDTLTLDAPDIAAPVGAVITSPPYPNAYEYWLYHKYRMWWLGYDPLIVKAQEIGARAHFFGANRHTANHFLDQMTKVFGLIDRVLTPNGYVCFVVGRSRIHGKTIDNAAIIEKAALPFSFHTIYRTERPIQSTRKSFNLSHANIKTETVLILRR